VIVPRLLRALWFLLRRPRLVAAAVALARVLAGRRDRIVAEGEPSPRAEAAVVALLSCSALSAAGFVAVYALDRLPRQTQLLGIALGAAFACLAAACFVAARHLVVEEQLEEGYPEPGEHAEAAAEIGQIVEESGSRLTRRKLLVRAGGMAAGALGVALVTPAVSLGPLLDTGRLYVTPWRRGRRLVDERGRPLRADAIEEEAFYTAFPEGADREQLGAPIVLVRLDPARLELPPERRGWAPDGILAYSKICTHAACAISLYRSPNFEPSQPRPALVCPCHYSTFDPATGGTVLFGPAGRPLPQLPLTVDRRGELRAGGNFSGPVGPSWWGVRLRKARP
jgi:ubiquinol-cytochrome c reductase iron-sulfur subunit